MSLKARNDIHLARRVWHFSGVMVIFVLYALIPSDRARITALVLSVPFIVLDVLRLYVPRINRALTWLFRPFMRENERQRLAGLSFLLAGVSLSIWLYPRPVVFLSLLFLAVADPLASYFGIRFGRDKLVGDKSLQGSMAAFAACFLLSLLYFSVMDLMRERMFIVCLISGLIGACAELIPVGKLDDNFLFPVVSGVLLTGVFYLFGGL